MASSLFPLEIPKGLFHDLQVEPEEARSILRPQRDERYGFGFALSPYRGCGHGCRYCYVRDYPQPVADGAPGALHDPEQWGTWATPKLNAPELLWAQRHRLHGQTVFLASATDPYQPLEREFRLTRGCLEVLLQCPTTRVLLHTRSPLALQDLELLKAFGGRLSVGFSIPTDDDTVRQVVEPKAPPIPSRWAAVERLAQARGVGDGRGDAAHGHAGSGGVRPARPGQRRFGRLGRLAPAAARGPVPGPAGPSRVAAHPGARVPGCGARRAPGRLSGRAGRGPGPEAAAGSRRPGRADPRAPAAAGPVRRHVITRPARLRGRMALL